MGKELKLERGGWKAETITNIPKFGDSKECTCSLIRNILIKQILSTKCILRRRTLWYLRRSGYAISMAYDTIDNLRKLIRVTILSLRASTDFNMW